MKTLSIGILGGIFDPPHHGHLAAASLAIDFCKLDFAYLVPAGLPPHKIGGVSASRAHRLAMILLALKNQNNIKIWDREIKTGGICYTVDTIARMRQKHPQSLLHFIIGADNLREIHTWKNYREILRHVTLCVVDRPGFSCTIPAHLKSARICRIPSPQWGLSSSLLRTYLAQGLSCRYCIPESVLAYIKKYKLYNGASRPYGRGTKGEITPKHLARLRPANRDYAAVRPTHSSSD
ncbi:MAG: nicotinate-nucleotide adenylyltransferase [Chitinivibrionales bacterium]|nr:nicotinate-nucleotide adenylyltransferase [Chitinivibrionales bacterium]